MEANIELDTVLDLIAGFQADIAARVDSQMSGSTAHVELWRAYKRTSQLYDDIRRAAK